MKLPKLALMTFLVMMSLFIAPAPPASADTEFTIVYAMPYSFEEYSQFNGQSLSTKRWMASVSAGLYARDLDNNRAFSPMLAEDMPVISSDGLEYTVTLKEDLKFSDGTNVTADDVVFTFQAILSPAINTNSYATYKPYLSNDSIVKIDDRTVKFVLDEPYAFMLTLLDAPIQPQAHFQNRLDSKDYNWVASDLSDTISAGPFVVDSFDKTNMEIVVVRNPYYWDADNVVSDRIIFKYIADKDAAVSAIADGSIDIFDPNYNPGKDAFKDIDGVYDEIVPVSSHQELGFNHLNDFYGTGANLTVADKAAGARDIREAISTIINRDYIANQIYEGMAVPAPTVIPSTSIGWDDSLDARTYSIDNAKTLMEQAGLDYSELGEPDAQGNYQNFFFNVTLMAPQGNSARETFAALIADTLPKIGIGVDDLAVVGWGEIIPRTFGSPVPPPSYAEGGFDMFFLGNSWDLDIDPTGIFDQGGLRPNGGNFYNFASDEYDALLAKYTGELDPAKRIAAFKDMQQFMYENLPVAAIVYISKHFAYAEDLRGYDSIMLNAQVPEWDRVGTVDALEAMVTPTNNSTDTSTSGPTTGFISGYSTGLSFVALFSLMVINFYRKRK